MDSFQTEVLILGAGPAGRMTAAMMEKYAPKVHFIIVDGGTGLTPISSEYGCNYFWKAIPELGKHNSLQIITSVDGGEPTASRVKRYKEKVAKSDDVNTPAKVSEVLRTQFKHQQVGWRLEEWPLLNIRWGMKAVVLSPEMNAVKFSDGVIGFYDRLISCIPLSTLSDIARLECEMSYRPIKVSVFRQRMNMDFMTVNYISDPRRHIYRETRFKKYAQYESLEEHIITDLEGLDVHESRVLWPGKIYPSAESKKAWKELDDKGIYMVGRYASWNPDLLLHRAAKYARAVAEVMAVRFHA